MSEDIQVIVPDYLADELDAWLRTRNGKLVRAAHLDSEDDLPIYIIGLVKIP